MVLPWPDEEIFPAYTVGGNVGVDIDAATNCPRTSMIEQFVPVAALRLVASIAFFSSSFDCDMYRVASSAEGADNRVTAPERTSTATMALTERHSVSTNTVLSSTKQRFANRPAGG